MKQRTYKPSTPELSGKQNDALSAIFRRDGSTLDRIDRKPSERKKRILILSFLFVGIAAALAVTGFFVFNTTKQFSSDDIRVAFEGPEDVASGDDQTFTVTITNGSPVDIVKTDVTVRYPTGYTPVSSAPSATNEFLNLWTIGTVKSGESASVRITGRLTGEIGDTKPFTATANFEPANFSSKFTNEATYTMTITDSSLSVAIDAPRAAASGQKVKLAVTVKNDGKERMERVRIDIEPPKGFAEQVNDPEPNDRTGQWDVAALDPGETTTVTIEGVVSGASGSTLECKVRVGLVDAGGNFLVQRERSALILLIEPALTVSLTAAPKNGTAAAHERESVSVELAYENASVSAVTDARLVLTYGGVDGAKSDVRLVDTATADTAGVADPEDDTMVWTKNELPALARLVPGAKGKVAVTLTLKSSLRSVGNGTNLALKVAGTLSGTTEESGSRAEGKSETVSVPVATDLRLSVEGRYFTEQGEIVGAGPLPPTPGLETRYRIFLYITNTLNGVNDAVVTLVLPATVQFLDGTSTSGNAVTFDEGTREVRWRLSSIEPKTGVTLATLTADFGVAVIPTEGDVGSVLALAGAASLSGSDAFAGVQVSATADSVTSELPFDPLAAGKGIVVAATTVNVNAQ